MSLTRSLVICLVLFAAGIAAQSCTYGSLQLVWGPGPHEGMIQICINNTWGWLCHNNFRTPDAQVVCNQLGYNPTGSIYRTYSSYGWPNASQPIWLDGINCVGNETTLLACPLSRAIGNPNCGYNALAAVICPNGGPSCTNQDVRLINRNVWTPYKGRGRIEVCISNNWRSICDDGWGSADAKVACYSLGWSKTRADATYNGNYGIGYVSIGMRNLQCDSSDNSVFDCSPIYNAYQCSANEVAGANCFGKVTGSCTNGDVALWWLNGIGPAHDGFALYCKNSQWTPVCDDSWSCHNGRLFCKQLGYPGVLNIRTARNHYGLFETTVDHNYWMCTSAHNSLSECPYAYHSNCNSATFDQMGVICYSPIIGNECVNGSVRLVGGSDEFEGRIQYCFEGFWYPVCQLSSATASLMCQSLGFNSTAATLVQDQRYGDSNVFSSLNYVNCTTSMTDLSQCNPVYKYTGGCRVNVARCGTEYGLRCHNATQMCNDGDLRLVNGDIANEGALEVCIGNVWGRICSTFPQSSAFVACRQLGYPGPNPLVLGSSYYGETPGPHWYSYVTCHGWETSLSECSKQQFPNGYCLVTWGIGLVCKDDCTNGDIRLVGGGFENEGTIETCSENQWSYIADTNFTTNNARVICRQLGYGNGLMAVPVLGSYYGKEKKPVKFKDLNCTGSENNFRECSLTILSQHPAASATNQYQAAGVDCLYDTPTDPPCIMRPSQYDTPGGLCTNGQVRLQGGDASSGRLEYCYNGYWSPFCKMDAYVAQVACRQLGFTSYTWGAIIESGEYGSSSNYSLFDNFTCVGNEASFSQCTMNTNATCTPYCRSNLGLRCYNPGVCPTEGAVRLVDGIIDNEGRVEVCVNGVWGSVCDQGWDKTDALVVCKQLGHPELEPYVFYNSTFGDGQYPIVYTNTACIGHENQLTSCTKQNYPKDCSRGNVAGLLCGYDCNDGDVRLVGSQYNYEGTVQVCFDHLWGAIADSGWTQEDAEVACTQLGFEPQGTVVQRNNLYGKPDAPIHILSANCMGSENSLTDCTVSLVSLQHGKNILATTDVAGVKCYTPDHCNPPPAGGSSCTNGQVRLTGGGQSSVPEGNVEYCYNGFWSPLCNLGAREATIMCRQLGYPDSNLTAVFDDGRFGMTTNTSLFQSISCNNPDFLDLSLCSVADACTTSCAYPLGLRCYETTPCEDGDVRLVNGSYSTDGRLEVCSQNHWGSVCSDGFDETDAYVVCNELGLGDSKPVVYLNSTQYGDGDGAIIYSNFGCKGFESSVNDCDKSEFGSFSCSRRKVVAVKCKDSCNDAEIRLVNGSSVTQTEGIVEVCYEETWGLVSDDNWGNEEAQVVCGQLGYTPSQAVSSSGSSYVRPNQPVQVTGAECVGSEATLGNCTLTLSDVTGDPAVTVIHQPVAVKCVPDEVTDNPNSPGRIIANNPVTITMSLVIVILIISVLVTISVIIYFCVKRNRGELTVKTYSEPYTMSGLREERGVENPLAGSDMHINAADGDPIYNDIYTDKAGLVDNM